MRKRTECDGLVLQVMARYPRNMMRHGITKLLMQ